jgi:hypothetical protein
VVHGLRTVLLQHLIALTYLIALYIALSRHYVLLSVCIDLLVVFSYLHMCFVELHQIVD